MKFSSKVKNCQLTVTVKTTGEKINANELNRASQLLFRGFLQPNMVKDNKVKYTGPMGVSLYEKLQKPISKVEFVYIVEQLVVAVRKLQTNNMGVHNLVMNLQNVYVNEKTRELNFIYLPTIDGMRNLNLLDFIRAICSSAKPSSAADVDSISRFAYFFQKLKPFNIDAVEDFLISEDPSTVNMVKRTHNEQSGFMTNKPKHYYDHYEEKHNDISELDYVTTVKEDYPTGLLYEEEDATGIIIQEDDDATGIIIQQEESYTGLLDEDYTGLLVEDDTGLLVEDDTGLLVEDNDTGMLVEDDTGMLVEDDTGMLVEDDTGLLVEDNDTGLLVEDDTGMLVEDDDTGLLIDDSFVRFPTLVRMITGEKIEVNKPVFRLGKEKSYVDYFVTNNIAVSRSHADIITRGSKYFVKDLNSKNHTFINNQQLPMHIEFELRDGDYLKLGNEEFIFNISKS